MNKILYSSSCFLGSLFMLSLSFSLPHAQDPASPLQYFWSPEFDTMYQNISIPEPMMGEESYFLVQPNYVKTRRKPRPLALAL